MKRPTGVGVPADVAQSIDLHESLIEYWDAIAESADSDVHLRAFARRMGKAARRHIAWLKQKHGGTDEIEGS